MAGEAGKQAYSGPEGFRVSSAFSLAGPHVPVRIKSVCTSVNLSSVNSMLQPK